MNNLFQNDVAFKYQVYDYIFITTVKMYLESFQRNNSLIYNRTIEKCINFNFEMNEHVC